MTSKTMHQSEQISDSKQEVGISDSKRLPKFGISSIQEAQVVNGFLQLQEKERTKVLDLLNTCIRDENLIEDLKIRISPVILGPLNKPCTCCGRS